MSIVSCAYFRVQRVSIPLATNPNFLNPQEQTLNLQAAMKNLHSNAVFYFLIPNTLDTVLLPSAPMEITSLVTAWKAIEDSLEVSQIVNGECFDLFFFLRRFVALQKWVLSL